MTGTQLEVRRLLRKRLVELDARCGELEHAIGAYVDAVRAGDAGDAAHYPGFRNLKKVLDKR